MRYNGCNIEILDHYVKINNAFHYHNYYYCLD